VSNSLYSKVCKCLPNDYNDSAGLQIKICLAMMLVILEYNLLRYKVRFGDNTENNCPVGIISGGSW